jgi:2-polyprenyl-6-hydroxyphenyl methylase / 3-demethylubiquinone-9 3-methyltransferase
MSTLDASEIAKFELLAKEWWNPKGKMRVLHKFNPVRLDYIREHACAHFALDTTKLKPLKGLRVLDIGCGGGLLSEPLARMGADVVGADPAHTNIETCKIRAEQSGIFVDYRHTSAEELAANNEQFDIVLAMEVVEHVADRALFMQKCAQMLKPNGLMFAATLNRTLKSLMLAKIGAEYILGWLPKGTHEFAKFVTTQEMHQDFTQNGVSVLETIGVIYNPLFDRWQKAKDCDVNYMVLGKKT